jgi:glycosyltransferase involved in cell wall biosynthesis
MRIVIDLGGLDTLTLRNGQYRFVVDLLNGLHGLDVPARFLVLGVRPEPVAEIAALFGDRRWTYRHFPRSAGRGSFYRDQARLSLILLKERADLCHCLHSFVPLAAPCPLVATQHDMMAALFPEYAETVRSRPYRAYRWAVRRRVRRVLCSCRATADDVHRLWRVPRNRLDIVYLGSNFTTAPPGADLPPVVAAIGDAPLLVSPYNLEPRKNLAALLGAFARLRSEVAGLRMVLFGRAAVTPEREQQFRDLVQRLGIEEGLLLTGFVPDEQLRALYERATLFVFPSLYEGFGFPVLEAMAAGACVVVRNASAMPEIVGEAGVCLETASEDELAAALRRLLADAAQRRALGEAARRRAAQFTVRRMAEQTFASYARALCGVKEPHFGARSVSEG